MADFGSKWRHVRDLGEGGQAHTFIVKSIIEGSSGAEYVAKRLKNPKREDRFKREIQAIERLEHPHILAIIEDGVDSKGRPFIVTEFCRGGSLKDCDLSSWSDLERFEFFFQICDAAQYAHGYGIYHRDIKPENIFLREGGSAVLGDFGICYVEDDGEITLTEDVMGSRYYCAPELRDGRAGRDIQPQLADIYSLGKLLYWLFTRKVFDGHEETYGEGGKSVVNHISARGTMVIDFDGIIAASLVDELVAASVVRDPAKREIRTALQFQAKIAQAIDRVRVGGRPLNLRLPKRCIFCGEGQYRPLHEIMQVPSLGGPIFPSLDKRRQPYDASRFPPQQQDPYDGLRTVERHFVANDHGRGFPLYLVCDFCGNVQYFRLDTTKDQHGEHWKS